MYCYMDTITLWHGTLRVLLHFVCFFKGLPYCLRLPWKCSKDSYHISVAMATAVFPIMSCIIWTDVTASCSRSHKAPPSIASHRCAVNIKRGWFEQEMVSTECRLVFNCTTAFLILYKSLLKLECVGFASWKWVLKKDVACLNIFFRQLG